MVLYRKHRPQTLDQLIGQENIKNALLAALSSGKLSHAYLFCGPKGTGKTSTARILAKMVNCETPGSQNTPCNKCSACLSVTDGSNIDVIEMDAASNRGIEDVRSLRENIKLSPTSAKKKVYIIDEVHMLTGDAFNALLKTLEEPPSHVLFILATTEVQKIPQTILSRVQRLDFKLANNQDLIVVLKKVALEEGIEIDDEALFVLAQKAHGSFRDGVKLLDQISAIGTKINTEVIEKLLGMTGFEPLIKLLQNIAQSNSKEALQILGGLVEVGINPRELTLLELEILRNLLFIKNDLGENIVKAEVGEERYKLLKKLADGFDLERIIQTASYFQKSLEQSRFVSIPTLSLELAVVESCNQRISRSVDQQISESESDTLKKRHTESTTHRQTEPPVNRDTETLIDRPADTPILSDSTDSSSSPDLQKIHDRWTYVLETIKQYNFSLEALLRSSKIASCEGGVVVVEVPYSFHQRILEAPKSRDLLTSIFSDILGQSVRISVVLGQRPVRREELANVEIAADDEIVRIASEIFSSDTIN